MKRILLISSLIAASTGAFAQSKTPATAPAAAQPASVSREASQPATPRAIGPNTPVTKSGFAEMVKGYNALLDDNKAAEAKEKFNDVNRMMMGSLRDMQMKYNAANEAKNEAEKKRVMENMTKQRVLFGAITQLRSQDMIANKAQINEKLNDFMNTIQ